jgi:hypothetical protein
MLLHSDHLGHQRPEASRFAALLVTGRLAGWLAGCVMSVLGWAVKVQKRNSCLGLLPLPSAPDFPRVKKTGSTTGLIAGFFIWGIMQIS